MNIKNYFAIALHEIIARISLKMICWKVLTVHPTLMDLCNEKS